MEPAKEKLLYDTYNLFMTTSISNDLPLSALDAILSEDISGFGTAVGEKTVSPAEFYGLMEMQRQQSGSLDLDWRIEPYSRHIAVGGNSAVFADDVFLRITVEGHTTEMELRFSIVLEYANDQWQIVHWHGSKPEELQRQDMFGVEGLKEKAAMLEKLVGERTAALQRQKESLEHTLAELHATQAQLVQSEKMASLGELTAGIAHEIQNPLNFVNNFSDVTIELLDEMEEELGRGNIEEAKAISGDIKQNLEKVGYHGRRADSIVKGMLQHSRASSGQKEPTDINKLADEYLRLAYHGLRSRDKAFNAGLITSFDKDLPLINVIPQDIGRVLLNLFTNAFYATQQKEKLHFSGYNPAVEVTTIQKSNAIEIIVKDNGTGIPEGIREKILQPFFTTKPTGEGTGLGLSLSYDIVVKGHGVKIAFESVEGAGAAFRVTLPLAG